MSEDIKQKKYINNAIWEQTLTKIIQQGVLTQSQIKGEKPSQVYAQMAADLAAGISSLITVGFGNPDGWDNLSNLATELSNVAFVLEHNEVAAPDGSNTATPDEKEFKAGLTCSE